MTSFRDQLPHAVLRAAQAGDIAAFEAIYRAYVGAVSALARRLLGDVALAQEACQDVFMALFERLPEFRFDGAFAGFVRSVAVHRILMTARHRRVLGRHEDNATSGVDPDSLAASDAAPEAGLDLEAALQALAPAARTVLWLHEVEGYGHAEIARLLERSESYSKSQLARAYQRLRVLLAPVGDKVVTSAQTNHPEMRLAPIHR